MLEIRGESGSPSSAAGATASRVWDPCPDAPLGPDTLGPRSPSTCRGSRPPGWRLAHTPRGPEAEGVVVEMHGNFCYPARSPAHICSLVVTRISKFLCSSEPWFFNLQNGLRENTTFKRTRWRERCTLNDLRQEFRASPLTLMPLFF